MQIKKDLFRVFNSNFINILVGIVNGFLVPAFLSLDHYAMLKTFALYISYVGILHFGIVDGLFIKYGGKDLNKVDIGKLKGERKFLLIFQSIITLVPLAFGILLEDIILIAFSLSIIPMNIQALYRYLYQAVGEFGIYSKILLVTPNVLLILNIFIIFVLKIDHYLPFVIANIISYLTIFVILESQFYKKYKGIKAVIDYKEIGGLFKVGIFIMIGNLSANLFFNADRWFVKFSLPSSDFAYYSFAISMVLLITNLMNSVTMTLYPYLAQGQKAETLQLMKKYIVLVGAFAAGGYFAFDFVVSTFIAKYIPSLDIIAILFAGFPAMIVINALYVNLYKANKLERTYVYTVVMMCLISIALNVVAIIFNKNTLSIALATTIAYYVWYIYSTRHFKVLKATPKELMYLILFFSSFYISTNYFNWLFGFIVYYIVILAITLLTYKREFFSLIQNLIGRKKMSNE